MRDLLSFQATNSCMNGNEANQEPMSAPAGHGMGCMWYRMDLGACPSSHMTLT